MTEGSNAAPGFAKAPGHRIDIAEHGRLVTVTASDGRAVARSSRARRLEETGYPPALYIPFADIDFAALTPSESRTHCPFKGEASYWRLAPAGKEVMWAYEEPYDEMHAIKGYGAFYPDRVTISEQG